MENEREMNHLNMMRNVTIEPGRGNEMTGMREPATSLRKVTTRFPTRRSLGLLLGTRERTTYQVKHIDALPGKRLSEQLHRHRSEYYSNLEFFRLRKAVPQDGCLVMGPKCPVLGVQSNISKSFQKSGLLQSQAQLATKMIRGAGNLLSRMALVSRRHSSKVRIEERPDYLWHENFIVHIASVLKPKTYVELGVYHCELFNRIVPYTERMIGLDLNPESGQYMTKSVKAEFKCLTTEDYAKELSKNPIAIDLLFIDADHSKEWVKKDFLSFFPFVSDQGVILLHDGYPKSREFAIPGSYCGDAHIAIEELSKDREEYEMVTIPMHPGLTICRKRKKQLPWK